MHLISRDLTVNEGCFCNIIKVNKKIGFCGDRFLSSYEYIVDVIVEINIQQAFNYKIYKS